MARPTVQQPPWGEGRAPYACRHEDSRGRLHPEAPSGTRTPFQRDRDRIIHASAFRRLKQKTQVFVAHEGDHYRTRLTHSLEVAQVARSIARVLGLDEDLCEALALAHDLGHTPFGHAGEDALSAAMAPFGGFDHNAQALKIVTRLEQRYPGFDGLNLTWEALEGMVKHNGPVPRPVPAFIAAYCETHDLEIASHASLEAQVAAISDDIAYNSHDIDDGLRAGLFSLEDAGEVTLVGEVLAQVRATYPVLNASRTTHELVRRLMGLMIEDVIAETGRRIAALGVETAAEVRSAGVTIAQFSPALQAHDRALKVFLFDRMYRHYRVNRMVAKAKRVVHDLFTLFLAEPRLLPPEWARIGDAPGSPGTAMAVADYIAGMTDRYALDEHRRLFAIERGY